MVRMVKHVVDTRQLKDRRFLEGLFELADEMKLKVKERVIERKHGGKVVASFFYQPSTRTKMSFDAAAKRIGAEVVGTENAQEFSSAFKGETIEHSFLATQEYFDVVVMRHPQDGAAKRAAYVLEIPFINAGDGRNQHPTQALLDLYTLRQRFGRIDNLKVAFVGDVKQGRTIRSLAYLLAQLKGNELVFVSPRELGLPDDMRAYLEEKKSVAEGVRFYETEDIEEVLQDVGALYVTRFQFEYVASDEERQNLMNSYRKFQITAEKVNRMKSGSIVMHPLPINREKSDGFPEITPDVDTHEKAWYFQQSKNGLYVRMALLDVLLSNYASPLYGLILDVP